MAMRLFFCAIFFAPLCAFVQPAPAQTGTAIIRGAVVDADGGAPLAFARLRLVEAHRTDQSHPDGTFRFAGVHAGTYTLIIQRIGYAAQEVRLQVREGQDTTLRIAMNAAAIVLAPTVVTGTVGEKKASEVISPTTVLDGAKLDQRLDGTLAGTVAGQPGVASTSMGQATTRPVVRGLGGDRVLVLEDGQRTGDLSSMTSDHAVAVDPMTVGRVEVVRGPMSLLYGSSALGGVINAVRDEVPTSLPDRLHGTASVQGTSGNSGVSGGLEARFPLAGLSVRAEASGRSLNDMRLPRGTLSNTDVRTIGAALGASRVFAHGFAGVAYRAYTNDYGLPGGFVGAHPGGVDIAMRRHTVRGVADVHFDNGVIEGARASASVIDYGHDELTRSGSVSTSFDQLTVAVDLTAALREHAWFSNGNVGARFQFRDVVTGGSLRTPPTQDMTGALFLVEEAELNRLRLQAGIRGDIARFEPQEEATVMVGGEAIPARPRSFAALSGAIGALFDAGAGVRVGASLSRSFRTPDFNELYSDGPHLASYAYEVGNPRLDPERGLGVDVFARVERPSVQAEVAMYANSFDGYIFPRNTGELGRQGERWKFQFSKRDALLSGAEGDVSWTPFGDFVVEVTGSYVLGRVIGTRDTIRGIGDEPDRLSAIYLPQIPPATGRIAVRWDRVRWFAGIGAKFAAAQRRLGDFEFPTAGYSVADANAGVRMLVGDRLHALTLRIDNALDRDYRDHLSRTKDVFPEAGRNVSLLYRITF
jgi:iron complex outermembrane receptor protein